jgi:hypothetical protein
LRACLGPEVAPVLLFDASDFDEAVAVAVFCLDPETVPLLVSDGFVFDELVAVAVFCFDPEAVPLSVSEESSVCTPSTSCRTIR